MKIKFKNQKEQNEAVKAVVDVFEGQPNLQNSYLMDTGIIEKEESLSYFDYDKSAWGNQKLISELTDDKILENIKNIQYNNNLPPSDKIERRVGANGYNITVEMETGVGKTFTYIKTIFELNKKYGWTKFIIVVPSIAIREGVHKQFEMTEDFLRMNIKNCKTFYL